LSRQDTTWKSSGAPKLGHAGKARNKHGGPDKGSGAEAISPEEFRSIARKIGWEITETQQGESSEKEG